MTFSFIISESNLTFTNSRNSEINVVGSPSWLPQEFEPYRSLHKKLQNADF